ncbi:MAG: hypothetical protein HUJ71_03455 [Pseudobutyrivibrio sp.]|nr:hypothetical protein [Pseudobutyrivibrio sp.]
MKSKVKKGLRISDKQTNIYLVVIITLALLCMLIGILGLKLEAVGVCAIVILEALLATLLNRIQLWIHGLVVMAHIVVGLVVDRSIFMVLMAAFYIACTIFLFVWITHESED